MKKFLFAFILIICALTSINAQYMINYTGKFLEKDIPVVGQKEIVFQIDDWIETHPNITFINGTYSVLLGSLNPFPADFFSVSQRAITVTIEGVLVVERQPISSIPYAIQARNAQSLEGNSLAEITQQISSNSTKNELNFVTNPTQIPSLKDSLSGNVSAQTIRVAYSYVSASGETQVVESAEISTIINKQIFIKLFASDDKGVTGIRVYLNIDDTGYQLWKEIDNPVFLPSGENFDSFNYSFTNGPVALDNLNPLPSDQVEFFIVNYASGKDIFQDGRRVSDIGTFQASGSQRYQLPSSDTPTNDFWNLSGNKNIVYKYGETYKVSTPSIPFDISSSQSFVLSSFLSDISKEQYEKVRNLQQHTSNEISLIYDGESLLQGEKPEESNMTEVRGPFDYSLLTKDRVFLLPDTDGKIVVIGGDQKFGIASNQDVALESITVSTFTLANNGTTGNTGEIVQEGDLPPRLAGFLHSVDFINTITGNRNRGRSCPGLVGTQSEGTIGNYLLEILDQNGKIVQATVTSGTVLNEKGKRYRIRYNPFQLVTPPSGNFCHLGYSVTVSIMGRSMAQEVTFFEK